MATVLILTTFTDFDHFSLVNQKRCHGNALGYCRQKTISNDAIYNYTKS